VRTNILTSDVGQELLVPVWLGIEDDSCLSLMWPRTKQLSAKDDSEFKGHIETGESVGVVKFRTRNIVDRESAVADDARDLLDANLASVVYLKRTPGVKSTVIRAEY
jgi:hypothetical protein